MNDRALPAAPAKKPLMGHDRPLFLFGLVQLLKAFGKSRMGAEADHGQAASYVRHAFRSSFAAMDIGLPGLNRIEWVKTMRTERPELREGLQYPSEKKKRERLRAISTAASRPLKSIGCT